AYATGAELGASRLADRGPVIERVLARGELGHHRGNLDARRPHCRGGDVPETGERAEQPPRSVSPNLEGNGTTRFPRIRLRDLAERAVRALPSELPRDALEDQERARGFER